MTVFQGAFILQALAVVRKRTDSVAVPVSGIPTPPSSTIHSSSFSSSSFLPELQCQVPSASTSTVVQDWALNLILSVLFLNPDHLSNAVHAVAPGAVVSAHVMGPLLWDQSRAGRQGAEEPNILRWYCPIATVSWNCSFSNSVFPFQVCCWWNPKWVK